jgi:hypothetical protein
MLLSTAIWTGIRKEAAVTCPLSRRSGRVFGLPPLLCTAPRPAPPSLLARATEATGFRRSRLRSSPARDADGHARFRLVGKRIVEQTTRKEMGWAGPRLGDSMRLVGLGSTGAQF